MCKDVLVKRFLLAARLLPNKLVRGKLIHVARHAGCPTRILGCFLGQVAVHRCGPDTPRVGRVLT